MKKGDGISADFLNIPPLKNVNILPSQSRLITASHHVRGKPTGHMGQADTLTYCVSGLCILHINGQNLLLRPGQMALSPRKSWRGRTAISEDLVLHEASIAGDIEGENILSHLHLTKDNYVVDILEEHLPLVTQSFDRLLGFDGALTEGYLFRAAATANLLGVYFAARVQREKNEHGFGPVLSYMHEHLDTGVTLSELAALVHMQPTYFIRIFKKTFRQSPIAYYNTLRVSTAIDLLSTTDLPLSELASRIGIADRYYFSNFFKTQCGISPDQYRKAAKSITQQFITT